MVIVAAFVHVYSRFSVRDRLLHMFCHLFFLVRSLVMVKVGVLGYFSPRVVARSWVRRLGVRVVDIFVPAR